ncbi:hypothetical protein BJY52DRAFT_1377680, partial [Lactarius psammicola]
PAASIPQLCLFSECRASCLSGTTSRLYHEVSCRAGLTIEPIRNTLYAELMCNLLRTYYSAVAVRSVALCGERLRPEICRQGRTGRSSLLQSALPAAPLMVWRWHISWKEIWRLLWCSRKKTAWCPCRTLSAQLQEEELGGGVDAHFVGQPLEALDHLKKLVHGFLPQQVKNFSQGMALRVATFLHGVTLPERKVPRSHVL